MFELIFLGVMGLYFLFSIIIIISAISWADHYKKPPGKVGFIAALVVFGPVFWDFIPVHAVYNYQCKMNAGFTVYKTLEQWKQENPGVAETLTPIERASSKSLGNLTRYQLNQRFVWEYESIMHPLKIHERNDRLVDIQTGEILARYVDFDTTFAFVNPAVIHSSSLRDYKWWLKIKSCESDGGIGPRPLKFQFNKFMYLLQHQKEFE